MHLIIFLLLFVVCGHAQSTTQLPPITTAVLEQQIYQHLLARDREEDWIESRSSDYGDNEISFVFDGKLYTLRYMYEPLFHFMQRFLTIETNPLPLGECPEDDWRCYAFTQEDSCDALIMTDLFDVSGQGTVDTAGYHCNCPLEKTKAFRSFYEEGYEPVHPELRFVWQQQFERYLLDVIAFFSGETYCVDEEQYVLIPLLRGRTQAYLLQDCHIRKGRRF